MYKLELKKKTDKGYYVVLIDVGDTPQDISKIFTFILDREQKIKLSDLEKIIREINLRRINFNGSGKKGEKDIISHYYLMAKKKLSN